MAKHWGMVELGRLATVHSVIFNAVGLGDNPSTPAMIVVGPNATVVSCVDTGGAGSLE